MDRNSFVFYSSFDDALSDLSDEQYGQMMRIISSYALKGVLPEINSPMLKLAWKLIKPQIDASCARYEKCVENGKKGGRPSKNDKNQKVLEEKPKGFGLKNQDINHNYNVNDNDNENENVENTLSQPQVTYSYNIYELFNENDLPCESSAWAFLNGTFKRTLPLLHDYHSDDIIQAVNNYISEFKNPNSWIYNKKFGFEIFIKKYLMRFLPCNYSASANLSYSVKSVTGLNQEEERIQKEKSKITKIETCPECNSRLKYFSDVSKWCDTCRTYYCWNKTDWIKSEESRLVWNW